MRNSLKQKVPAAPRFQFGIRDAFALVAAIALVVAAMAALHRLAVREKGPWRPFEASDWREATPTSHYRTVRSEMVDNLLAQFDFTGWTRTEIVDLLGPPTRPPAGGSGFDQWDMYYYLGLERAGSYSLDDEALGFKFDSSGRVVRFGTSVN
jgi:hypothetical protein